LLLVVLAVSTQIAQAQTQARTSHRAGFGMLGDPTATPEGIPTVSLPTQTPITVPTVALPQPTPTPTVAVIAKPRHSHHRARRAGGAPTVPAGVWIWAYLTSYCPGSAGWLSSSGMPVYYGMLANDYYSFGTHVYIPVIGMTGVVEDRLGAFSSWNHFDVWSPTCYGTPTGYFKVEVELR
jgi:hypothetical protein